MKTPRLHYLSCEKAHLLNDLIPESELTNICAIATESKYSMCNW